MKHDDRYVWLDLIRGMSALFVCAYHLRLAIFVDYSSEVSPNVLQKIFYFVTALGHQAVLVFFVLSGFFIGGSVLSRRSGFRFNDYLIARLSRLWTVLLPALILTALIDLYLAAYHPSVLAGEDFSELRSWPNNEYSSSLLTLLLNMLFLQNILGTVFGSNAPLWSLSNEFWYYMLFPLLMISFGYVSLARNKRLMSFAALILIGILSFHLISGFIIWLFGVLVYVHYEKSSLSSSKGFLVTALLLFLLSLVVSKTNIVQAITPVSSDMIVGISISVLLFSLKEKNAPKRLRVLISKISRWLSEISYSLYLFHYPLVLVIYADFYRSDQINANFNGILQYLFWLSFLVIGAWIFWWIFERNTNVVRKIVTEYVVQRSIVYAKGS